MVKITHVMAPKPGQTSAAEVSQEVKDDVDGLYAYLTENPKEEGRAEFDTLDERKSWIKQVRAYCPTREAGALKFRILPSKSLPITTMRFQLTADLPTNGSRNVKNIKVVPAKDGQKTA